MSTLLTNVEILEVSQSLGHASAAVLLCLVQDDKTRRVMAERIRDRAKDRTDWTGYVCGLLMAAKMLEGK